MKKLAIMFLISAMALSLVACGSKAPKEEEESTKSVASIVVEEKEEEEAGDPTDFIALWQYEEYPSGFAIYENGTYELFAADTEGAVYEAEWEMLSDCMVLYNTYGGEETTLSFKSDGNLIDKTGDTLIKCGPEGFQFDMVTMNNGQTSQNDYTQNTDNNQYYDDSYDNNQYNQNYQGNGDYNNNGNSNFVDYVSAWKSENNEDYVIRIYEDSSFDLIQNGQVTSGYCDVGGDSVNLYFSDGTPYNSISFTDSGDIMDQNGVTYYVP